MPISSEGEKIPDYIVKKEEKVIISP